MAETTESGDAEEARHKPDENPNLPACVHDDEDWPCHAERLRRSRNRALRQLASLRSTSRDSEAGTCGYECPFTEEAHRDWRTFDGQTDHAFEPRSTSQGDQGYQSPTRDSEVPPAAGRTDSQELLDAGKTEPRGDSSAIPPTRECKPNAHRYNRVGLTDVLRCRRCGKERAG